MSVMLFNTILHTVLLPSLFSKKQTKKKKSLSAILAAGHAHVLITYRIAMKSDTLLNNNITFFEPPIS